MTATIVDPRCADFPELFYARDLSAEQDAAIALCRVCPFLDACRDECDRYEASATGGDWGVWAGETPYDRAERRRKARRARPFADIAEERLASATRELYAPKLRTEP